MSNPRIAAFVILIALAIITRILVLRDQQSERPAGLPEARSDYALLDFELTAMDHSGQRSFNLVAPRLEKDPTDESAKVVEPKVDLYDEAELNWRVTADTGWVRGDGGEIRLSGNVALESQHSEPVTVNSEALVIFPERRQVTTPAEVVLRRQNNTMTGKGLRADLESNRWELLSDVKTRFDTIEG
ncbi:MAG: LPS export ABC transporter periplasmic protein LptC [Xanthomonadales bacterium]|nr:LPS export ABC transporter periplasmic protein LptC [Xanthomonadales bacterium]